MATTKRTPHQMRVVPPPPAKPDDNPIVPLPEEEAEPLTPTVEQAQAIAETPTTQTPQSPPTNAPVASVEPAMDPLEEASMLIARLNEVRANALQTGLATIHDQIAKLRTLGFDYTLTEGQAAPTVNRGGRPPSSAKKVAPSSGGAVPKNPVEGPSAKYDPQKECGICGVVGHDGRVHRGQTTKKKLTAAEMAAFGVASPK